MENVTSMLATGLSHASIGAAAIGGPALPAVASIGAAAGHLRANRRSSGESDRHAPRRHAIGVQHERRRAGLAGDRQSGEHRAREIGCDTACSASD